MGGGAGRRTQEQERERGRSQGPPPPPPPAHPRRGISTLLPGKTEAVRSLRVSLDAGEADAQMVTGYSEQAEELRCEHRKWHLVC